MCYSSSSCYSSSTCYTSDSSSDSSTCSSSSSDSYYRRRKKRIKKRYSSSDSSTSSFSPSTSDDDITPRQINISTVKTKTVIDKSSKSNKIPEKSLIKKCIKTIKKFIKKLIPKHSSKLLIINENILTPSESSTSSPLPPIQNNDIPEYASCSICLENKFLRQPSITNCGHVFCNECITNYEKEKHSCPLCRETNITIRLFYP